MTRFLIEGGHPLSGRVKPSGNKNEVLPAIAACLLTDETINLKRVPHIQDVVMMCQILTRIGVEVTWEGEDLFLNAKNAHSHIPDPELCSHLRASILFIGPMLARFGKIELGPPGGDVIGARRLDTHFEGVAALGGRVEFDTKIVGSIDKIVGNDIFMDEPSVTATENLLMLAVRCEGKTTIHNAACEPHIVGLCDLLTAMGAKISGIGSNRLEITGVTSLHGASHLIGPDFMEVGSFICLGAIASGHITIEDVNFPDLRFALKTFSRLGISTKMEDETTVTVFGGQELQIQNDVGGRIPTIYSGPWPAFASDLMSVAIVAATQAKGTVIFHEKMYEGRMFFIDKLMAMGANIVLCDPHRVVINGPCPLVGANLSSPDLRAGMALVMAALIAKGKSEIANILQIERGYANIQEKLTRLGAVISRLD